MIPFNKIVAALSLIIISISSSSTAAFVLSNPKTSCACIQNSNTLHTHHEGYMNKFYKQYYQPTSLTKQRKSMAQIQTMGLFGLGAPEIAVILILSVFLIGPQKLGELTKDAGKMSAGIKDEWKDIPKEFQKGFEEGEIEAKSRNAKPMQALDDGKKDD